MPPPGEPEGSPSQGARTASIDRLGDELRAHRVGGWLALALLCLALPLSAALVGGWDVGLSIIVSAVAVPVAWRLWAPERAWKATNRLAEFDDPRAIGPLARAIVLRTCGLDKVVMARLTEILLRVKASDSPSVTPEDRLELCNAVDAAAHRGAYSRERDFIVAALGALEQLGGEESVPCVMALARSEPRDDHERRIVEAAQACLPALCERAQAETIASRLLRPADAPDDAATTLLRPALGVGETDPALLLRASDAPDGEE